MLMAATLAALTACQSGALLQPQRPLNDAHKQGASIQRSFRCQRRPLLDDAHKEKESAFIQKEAIKEHTGAAAALAPVAEASAPQAAASDPGLSRMEPPVRNEQPPSPPSPEESGTSSPRAAALAPVAGTSAPQATASRGRL